MIVRKAGLFTVMIGALALSFSGQVHAVTPLLGVPMGVVLALTNDLATVLALAEATTAGAPAPVRRWAWSVLLLAGGTALGLNTWHAIASHALPTPAAVAVGAGPVVLAWLLSHLVTLVIGHHTIAKTELAPAHAAATASRAGQAATDALPGRGDTDAAALAAAEAEALSEAATEPQPEASPQPGAEAGPQAPSETRPAAATGSAARGSDLPASGGPAKPVREAPARAHGEALIDRAERLERQAIAETGRGISYRKAARRLGVRFDAAKAAVNAARDRMTSNERDHAETAA